MKQVILCVPILLFTFFSVIVKADCSCICVNGKITEVCANSWDIGGGYCSGGYCSDTKSPDIRFNTNSFGNKGVRDAIIEAGRIEANAYKNTNYYDETTRNAAGALGAIMFMNEIAKQNATPEQKASRLILSTQKQFKQVKENYRKKVDSMSLPRDIGNGLTLQSSWIIDGKRAGLFARFNYTSKVSVAVIESDKKKIKQLVNRMYCTGYNDFRKQGIGIQVFIYNTLGQSVNAASNLLDCLKAGYKI